MGGGRDSEKVEVGIWRVEEVGEEEVGEEEERGKEWIGGERRYVKWSLREEVKKRNGGKRKQETVIFIYLAISVECMFDAIFMEKFPM